ncbi:MAG: hypothetical protein WC410_00230 [Candidatus Paceibacterota bacterium]|jgi:hypothetical protein
MSYATNPKKNPAVRRKNRPKLIGGVYIPADLLAEAQKRRIELMRKEIVHQAFDRLPILQRLWWRLKFWIQHLWTKKPKQ